MPTHTARRARLLERATDGPLIVRGAAAPESLRYLTGLAEPRATLLLSAAGVDVERGRPGPDYVLGRSVRSALFLPPSDPRAAVWGEDASVTLDALTAEDAGVDAVLAEGALNAVLDRALRRDGALHHVQDAPPTLAGSTGDGSTWLNTIRERFVGLRLHDASPLVHEMRRLKDADEVQAIRAAIEVTAEALECARDALRPGRAEHEIEAELARVYRAHGATHAFGPIVGAGANALKLHYRDNDGPVADGDLVLIDTGARLHGYCADVTRTYPASGRFSPRQREIYRVVLDAQRRAIDGCVPGRTLADLHREAWEVIDAAGFGHAFIHGTGHHLGLEVHDVGELSRPLEPGAVVTVEPGIYLRDESIGVRIEDDVLVTDGAPEVLSAAVPKSVDAVERPS